MPKAQELQQWIITEVIPTCKGKISNQWTKLVMNSESEEVISGNTAETEPFTTIKPTMIIKEKHMRFGEDVYTFVYIDDGRTLWFLGTCVAKSLEYSDTDKAIRKYVNTKNTTTIQSFHVVPPNWRDLIRNYNIQTTSKFITQTENFFVYLPTIHMLEKSQSSTMYKLWTSYQIN